MDNEDFSQEQVGYEIAEEQLGCKMCGNSDFEVGHAVELCKTCREKLYKRPFPKLIKMAFAIIALILVVALIRFPTTVKAGVALERGLQAEKEGKYVTAMNEYKKVTGRFPDSTLALGRLFIATYNNGNITEADGIFKKISGKNAESDEFADEVNSTINRLTSIYYISDEFNKIIQESQNTAPQESIKLIRGYIQKNPEDVQASYYYSNALYDLGKYDEAKTVMEKILVSNSDFYNGQLMLAAIYREKGEFDKATQCCNIVINYNCEYSFAYSSLAKIELKNHNDKKGLELAKRAYELDSNSSNIVATLAIAYHYNKMINERDNMIEKFKRFNDNNTYDLNLMNGIFSGKINWRE